MECHHYKMKTKNRLKVLNSVISHDNTRIKVKELLQQKSTNINNKTLRLQQQIKHIDKLIGDKTVVGPSLILKYHTDEKESDINLRNKLACCKKKEEKSHLSLRTNHQFYKNTNKNHCLLYSQM